jgi:putative membrane protein
VSTPAEAAPPAPRKGVHVPVWLVVVLGLLVVGFGALIVGRAISHRRGRVAFGGRFDGGHVGHPIFWILVAVIFFALIIAAVVALVRHYWAQPGEAATPTTVSSAEELLAQRFARGEIDEDEYRRRRDTLRG